MAVVETRLEQRARMLSQAATRKVSIVSTALRPAGSRPSFTQQFSKPGALDWWLQNWNQPAGISVLGHMDPQSRMELNAAMSQHIERQQLTPGATGPASVFG